ncbi:hypothetical protein, partial [Shigella sonnei]|uniref:hypothetical protein n=1 Tax=Shigella sonnei TaxID=624 RepID=UPI001C12A5E8|nr:TetR/AcrR family transcriptional regulator [Shigella sonnei]
FAQTDLDHLNRSMARAEQLSRDPVQQVLIFVGLMREGMAELTEPYPGCLFASYCYEADLFDERTLTVIAEAMNRWRERLGGKLSEIMAQRP